MNINATIPVTRDMDSFNTEIQELLENYYHNASEYGVNKILETWATNKANLLGMLSKHPLWDSENMRIVFSKDYERQFDPSGIWDFCRWAKRTFTDYFESTHETEVNGYKCYEYDRLKGKREAINDLLVTITNLNDCAYKVKDQGISIKVKNNTVIGDFLGMEMTYEQLKMYKHTLDCEINAIKRQVNMIAYGYNDRPYVCYDYKFFTKENYEILQKFLKVMDYFGNKTDYPEKNKVTQDILDRVKQWYPDIKIGVGSTITKLLRKICIQHSELRDFYGTEITSWTDPTTGEYREREKAVTLESKLSELGDRISPLKIKRYTIISLNPLDYLMMSFGHKWASCHTIDKENQRGVGSNHHQGCYCSGTLSYMLDTSSVIFYTVDESYNGTQFEYEDKMQRCMFYINADGNIIVQSRVYPDGRDGGDSSLAKQFREVMQKVLSDALDRPNFWTLKTGSSNCSQFTKTTGTHYADYTNYDDGTVSIRQNVEISEENKIVKIGHYPIDPDTGREHCSEDSLNECYRGGIRCAECGGPVDEDEGIRDVDTDNWYCCEDCAENADVYYCQDDYEWHSDCYEDDYDNNHYSGNPEVETEDGHYFHSWENAERAGYSQDDDGFWYPEDEIHYDANREYYFHEDNDSVEIDGDWYVDAESAREAGFVEVNGDWYSEDECVEIDEKWYLEDDDDIVESAYYGNWILKCNAVTIIDGDYYESEEELNDAGFVFSVDQDAWIPCEEDTTETNSDSDESEVA